MDEKLFGYCGIDCTDCSVFKATAADDDNLRRKCAEDPLWKNAAANYWGMKELDPKVMNCRGCKAEGDDIFLSCAKCPIRRCARDKRLDSCGRCADWQACRRLVGLFDDVPQARENLRKLSAEA